MTGRTNKNVITDEEKLNGLKMWWDSNKTPMTKLNLTEAVVTDELLAEILTTYQETLTELDMTNVSGLTYELNALLEASNAHFPNLTSVKMTSMELLCKEGLGSDLPIFTSRCPNVKHLLLPKTQKPNEENDTSLNPVLSKVLEPLHQLETLDLSCWTNVGDLRCIQPLHQTLTSLILYDVPDLHLAVSTITQMTELTYLDISQSQKEPGFYPRPVSTLHQIVSCLPKLTHLDISSTNLAAQPTADDLPAETNERTVQSDIIGLQSLEKPLVYLGLFNCNRASHLRKIPAETVAGDANEDQIVKSLQMYKERPGLLRSVLRETYQLYRFGSLGKTPLSRHAEALHWIVDGMERHLLDSTLQTAGAASVFYIIKRLEMDNDTKKRVVKALLNGMEVHMKEEMMVKNCCLSLAHLEIPDDVLSDYSRLAVLLVTILRHHTSDVLTQRIVVSLCNSMAARVKGDQKVKVGTFGAIETILEQIRLKHYRNTLDDVLEVGWSFLWNITDETPVNSARFLNAGGLDLFEMCYETFKTERRLVLNMIGLIGNIAEVDDLRCQLMKNDYVKIFCELLVKQDDSIEISYNAAGILANLVSVGEEAWTSRLKISREKVMKSIVKEMTFWEMPTHRFINYTSLRPILRLLPIYHSSASQYWAVWALANLTTIDGEKYCTYLRNEEGVPLLEELVSNEITTDEIRALAQTVLDCVQEIESRKEMEILDITDEQSDDEWVKIDEE